MHTQIGTCPKCGAPIWANSVDMSVLPPAPIFTCRCTEDSRRVETRTNTTYRLSADPGRGPENEADSFHFS